VWTVVVDDCRLWIGIKKLLLIVDAAKQVHSNASMLQFTLNVISDFVISLMFPVTYTFVV